MPSRTPRQNCTYTWSPTPSPALARWPDSARTYLPGGKPPAIGQVFSNPDLAWSYRQIADDGAEAFYEGEIAEELGAWMDGTMRRERAQDLFTKATWLLDEAEELLSR